MLPENATDERKRLLRLYGAEIVLSPAAEGSNGAVRLALELAERDPRWFVPFQYANAANPRAHYEGTGAEIADALDRVDVLVAGLGTGGTLMGAGERLRESFPDVVVAAAEPLPGDPVMGLRSLDDGYVPPILDVSKLDRKVLVSNAESVAAVRDLLRLEGILGGVSAGAVVHVARRLAERARRGRRRRRPRRRRLEVPVRRLLGRADDDVARVDGADRLVVIPAAVRGGDRRARARRAPERGLRARAPRGRRRGRVRRRRERRRRRRTASSSQLDPVVWADLGDRDVEQAVVHSHVSSPPRPSRTDVERIGLWRDRPYVIYSVRLDELAAWRIRSTAGSSRSRSDVACEPDRSRASAPRPARTATRP